MMKEFVAAFQTGDAAAAAAFMTAEAELIPDDGDGIKGRDAIQKAYAAHFAKGLKPKVMVEIDSFRFPSRDTAIQAGSMTVMHEGESPETHRSQIHFVREDGKWLLSVTQEYKRRSKRAKSVPSARRMSFAVARRGDTRSADETRFVERLTRAEPGVKDTLTLAERITHLVRTKNEPGLDPWLADATASGLPEFRAFAMSFRQDEAAVRAGLSLPWSNGPVEGAFNRLKNCDTHDPD